MHLSLANRLYAVIGRRIARFLVHTPAVRDRIARRRGAAPGGRVVEPETAAILALDDLSGDSDLRPFPPARARVRMARAVYITDGDAPTDVGTRDLTWTGPGGAQRARLYEPHGLAAPSPGLLYVHGGGFVVFDVDSHDTWCRTLARSARIRVVSIDYRLAPEHPFPAAAEDAVAAFRWLAGAAPGLGMDPARLAVSGDSAGGNLTAVVSLGTRADEVRPALQVPIYPAVDTTCSHPSHPQLGEGWMLTSAMIEWYYRHYAGEDAARRRDPIFSPLLAEDVRGCPPALVYTAGLDPLRDEGHAWAAKLRAAGVPVRDTCFDPLIHGFLLFTGLSPGSREAAERIATEVGDALRLGGPR